MDCTDAASEPVIETKPIEIHSMRKKWDEVFQVNQFENQLHQKEKEVFEEMQRRKHTSHWSNQPSNWKTAVGATNHLPLEKRPTCDRIEIVPENNKEESIKVLNRTLEWNKRLSSNSLGSLERIDSKPLNARESSAEAKRVDVLGDIKSDQQKEKELRRYQQLNERRQQLKSQEGRLSVLEMSNGPKKTYLQNDSRMSHQEPLTSSCSPELTNGISPGSANGKQACSSDKNEGCMNGHTTLKTKKKAPPPPIVR